MNVDGATLIIQLLLLAGSLLAVGLVDRRLAGGARTPEAPGAQARPVLARIEHVGRLLLIAAWFGLATGVLHLLLAFITRFVRGHFVMVGPAIIWMAPLAYVWIFVFLGLGVSIAAALKPQLVPLRFAFGGFAWLGVFALFLPFIQVHRFAAALVAAGVAVQLSRIMARHADRWVGIMRASGLVASVAIVLLSLGLRGWRGFSERQSILELADARPGAPNVLLLVLDTVRAANLSLFGYDRPTTPELERVAQDAAIFDLALSTGPWTLKSHATMFTGLYPSQIEGDFVRPVRTESPMLAELLRDRGYMTGGFVANLPYTSYESGLNRGFVRYDDYRVRRRQILLHSWIAQTPLYERIRAALAAGTLRDAAWHMREAVLRPSLEFEPDMFNSITYGRRPAAEIADSFLQWQATVGDRPFFAFLNFFDAHAGYIAPTDYLARFALEENRNLGRYDGAIAYIDGEIGRMLDELEQRGVLDNTIVIVTADHGEHFGERGLEAHANSLYVPLLHVPLLIRYPKRVPRGLRIATPVTLRDLAATVVDLADMQPEVTVPGTTLTAAWSLPDSLWHRSALVAEIEEVVRPLPNTPVAFGPMRSAFDDELHYIRRGDGFEELYAWRSDRAEMNNLARSDAVQGSLARLREILASVGAP